MTAPLPGHTASNLSRDTPPPLLEVHSLSLEYRTAQRVVRATHQVSFDVDQADRFVLLGPSGCGKSTLLKAVAGFIAPQEGKILLQGHPVSSPGPDRIVVFQEFDQLPPWKTVKENIMFPLVVSGQLKRAEPSTRKSSPPLYDTAKTYRGGELKTAAYAIQQTEDQSRLLKRNAP